LMGQSCDVTRTGTRLGHHDWLHGRRSCPDRLRSVRRDRPSALARRARRPTTRTFQMSDLAPQVVCGRRRLGLTGRMAHRAADHAIVAAIHDLAKVLGAGPGRGGSRGRKYRADPRGPRWRDRSGLAVRTADASPADCPLAGGPRGSTPPWRTVDSTRGWCRFGGGHFVTRMRAGQRPAPDDERSDRHDEVPARAVQGR